MIENIRHKGLRLFFEDNSPAKLTPHLVGRIREVLSLLDTAETLAQLNIPGYRLHKLISANYRIIFRFENGNALDVDFIDYH